MRSFVMAGLVPAIHALNLQSRKVVDARDIGGRKHAVLWTAMPGHDGSGDRKLLLKLAQHRPGNGMRFEPAVRIAGHPDPFLRALHAGFAVET